MRHIEMKPATRGALRAAAPGALLLALAMAAPARADQASIERGKYLATAGDCISCHSAPGGPPLAGGLHVNTPFGYIASPNITPDRDTGIGDYSDDQFYRVMHEGIDDHDRFLYPAMPFTSYTMVTREDVQAIKDYLFSTPPVHKPNEPNGLSFPFDVRASLEAWRIVNFHAGTFKPDPSKSAQINRGAYLVEGLGHCAECHSQRNSLGGIKDGTRLEGGPIDGWYAPNISGNLQEGVGSWSDDKLFDYLKTGAAPGKGVVYGPMYEVVHMSLSKLNDDDIHAMVAYLKQTQAKGTEVATSTANGVPNATNAAADSYLNYCASCHQLNGKGVAGAIPALAGNGSVTAAGPENAIRAVIGGLPAASGYGPMPAFGADMTSQQIAEAVNYIRMAWGNNAAANADATTVTALAEKTPITMFGKEPCPPVEDSKATKLIADKSSGVDELIKGITDANMLDRAAAIAAKAKDAGATDSASVNALWDAYCPVAAGTEGRSPAERRWDYNRFGQLIYGRLHKTETTQN